MNKSLIHARRTSTTSFYVGTDATPPKHEVVLAGLIRIIQETR